MTANEVALVEVGECVGDMAEERLAGAGGTRGHQGAPLQLSGCFQAALESGLKSPSEIRQGNVPEL